MGWDGMGLMRPVGETRPNPARKRPGVRESEQIVGLYRWQGCWESRVFPQVRWHEESKLSPDQRRARCARPKGGGGVWWWGGKRRREIDRLTGPDRCSKIAVPGPPTNHHAQNSPGHSPSRPSRSPRRRRRPPPLTARRRASKAGLCSRWRYPPACRFADS